MDLIATQVIDNLSEDNFLEKSQEKQQIGVLEHDGIVYPVFTGKTTIGRDTTCDIVIPSNTLSKLHAILETDGDNVFIEDNKSTNGTCIGQIRLKSGKQYHVMDKTSITLGDLIIAFRKHSQVADEENVETVSNADSDTLIPGTEEDDGRNTSMSNYEDRDADITPNGDEGDTENDDACTQFDDSDFISTTPEASNQMTQFDDLPEVSNNTTVKNKNSKAECKKDDKLSTLIRSEDTRAPPTDQLSSMTVKMLEMDTQAPTTDRLSSMTLHMLEMDTQAPPNTQIPVTDRLSSMTVKMLEMDTQAPPTDQLSSMTLKILEMDTQAPPTDRLSSMTPHMLEMDTQAPPNTQVPVTDRLSSMTVKMLEMDTQAPPTDRLSPTNISMLEMDTQAPPTDQLSSGCANILELNTQASMDNSTLVTAGNILTMETQPSFTFSKSPPISTKLFKKKFTQPTKETILDMNTQATSSLSRSSKESSKLKNIYEDDTHLPANILDLETQAEEINSTSNFNESILNADTQCHTIPTKTIIKSSVKFKCSSLKPIKSLSSNNNIFDADTQECLLENSFLKSAKKSTELNYSLKASNQSTRIEDLETQCILEPQSETIWAKDTQDDESEELHNADVVEIPESQDTDENIEEHSTHETHKNFNTSLNVSDLETEPFPSYIKTVTPESHKNDPNSTCVFEDQLSMSQIETQVAPMFCQETELQTETRDITNLEDKIEDISVSQMETQIAPFFCDSLREDTTIAQCHSSTINIMYDKTMNISVSEMETQLAPTLSQLNTTNSNSTPMHSEPPVTNDKISSNTRRSVKFNTNIPSCSSEEVVKHDPQKKQRRNRNELEASERDVFYSKEGDKSPSGKKLTFSSKSADSRKDKRDLFDFKDDSESVLQKPFKNRFKAPQQVHQRINMIQQDNTGEALPKTVERVMRSKQFEKPSKHTPKTDSKKSKRDISHVADVDSAKNKLPSEIHKNVENMQKKTDALASSRKGFEQEDEHSKSMSDAETTSKNAKSKRTTRSNSEDDLKTRETSKNITMAIGKEQQSKSITPTKKIHPQKNQCNPSASMPTEASSSIRTKKTNFIEKVSVEIKTTPREKVFEEQATAKKSTRSTPQAEIEFPKSNTRASDRKRKAPEVTSSEVPQKRKRVAKQNESKTSQEMHPGNEKTRKTSESLDIITDTIKIMPKRAAKTNHQVIKPSVKPITKSLSNTSDQLGFEHASCSSSLSSVLQQPTSSSARKRAAPVTVEPTETIEPPRKSRAHARESAEASDDPKNTADVGLKITRRSASKTTSEERNEPEKNPKQKNSNEKEPIKFKVPASKEVNPPQPSPRITRSKFVKSDKIATKTQEGNLKQTSSVSFGGCASSDASNSSSPATSSVESTSTVFTTSPTGLMNLSQSSRKSSQSKQKTLVMFSGYVEGNQESLAKYVKQLGGNVIDAISNQDCVLVVKTLKRTIKSMSMLGRGLPIVTEKWLLDSKKAGNFLDPWLYLIRDRTHEKKYNFSLKTCLEKCRKGGPVLKGLTFSATDHITPAPEQLKVVLENAGASYHKLRPSMWPKPSIVVTCEEDRDIWPNLRGKPSSRHHKPVLLKIDGIWESLQRQVLTLDEYKFEV